MFLLIGGLGDSELSLSPWRAELATQGEESRYISVDVAGNKGFSDRVDALCTALKEINAPVNIIGQSAGGLAALIVASENPDKVKGVIAVSPAMPRGISPLGWPLLKLMWRYSFAMLQNKLITVREKDYCFLSLNGIEPPKAFRLLKTRQPISGREATELVIPWLQPKLGKVTIPVILVSGSRDHWVNPDAHGKLFLKLQKENSDVHLVRDPDAGHMPAHAYEGKETVKGALLWLNILNHERLG